MSNEKPNRCKCGATSPGERTRDDAGNVSVHTSEGCYQVPPIIERPESKLPLLEG